MEGEQKRRVLIVEDDDLISEIYEKKLSMEGFSVRVAENGEKALSMISEEMPDIVFLDVIMPVKNGLETLREIRKSDRFKRLPVVMLSNLSQDEEKAWARSLGADDYLVKTDISIQELARKTREYLSRSAFLPASSA